jgi:hypothetical protein
VQRFPLAANVFFIFPACTCPQAGIFFAAHSYANERKSKCRRNAACFFACGGIEVEQHPIAADHTGFVDMEFIAVAGITAEQYWLRIFFPMVEILAYGDAIHGMNAIKANVSTFGF